MGRTITPSYLMCRRVADVWKSRLPGLTFDFLIFKRNATRVEEGVRCGRVGTQCKVATSRNVVSFDFGVRASIPSRRTGGTLSLTSTA